MRRRRIDELVRRLTQPPVSKLGEIDPTQPLSLNFSSNMTREQFEAAVIKGKEYIKAGDIFQFVPSAAAARAERGAIRSTSTGRCGSSTRRRSCSI